MSMKRGRRVVVDVGPQSVTVEAGGVSLSATTAPLTDETAHSRRAAESGVVEMRDDISATDAVASPPTQGHFKVPTAVLQRIQQRVPSTAATQTTTTTTTVDDEVSAAAPPAATPPMTSSPTAPVSTPSSPPSAAPPPLPRSTAPSDRLAAAAVVVEDVSEADITATMAAHKTTASSAEAPHLPGRKPIVLSRQWRRRLFSGAAATVPAVSGSRSDAPDADEEAEDALPFGTASVVKFSRTHVDDVEGDTDVADDNARERQRGGASLQPSAPLTRRQRHAQRLQAQETRERQRVRQHMTGFDVEFLHRHEARLQVHASASESTSAEDDDDDTDELAGSSAEDAGSDAEVGVSSVEEGPEGEDVEAEGEGVSSSVSEVEATPAPPSTGAAATTRGGGFGAVERAQRAAHAHRAEGRTADVVGDRDSVATAAAGAARSLWLKSFFFICHEKREQRGGGCHHTLVGLRGPVTIQGPCGVIGFGIGEVSVGGFYLGRKQLCLWHEEHRAMLTPMKRLKGKQQAQKMEVPQWPHPLPAPTWPPGAAATAAADEIGQPLYCRRGSATAAHQEEEEEGLLQSLQWDCESVFGSVDWDWVEATVQSWRSLFANQLPPILLFLQPPSSMPCRNGAGPTRKFFLRRKRRRDAADAGGTPAGAYMDLPSFVAHRSEPSADVALLPSVVPSIATLGCGAVMVLGSANIGKSTLCRYIANIFVSQHGLCYWLDLDLGQPEFGVPGQLTLSLVRRPLLRPHDASCVELVAAFFVGAVTAGHCPLTLANAVAAVCAQACEVGRAHPVVVNTHGWVLQTGRRASVEALRRLRPRQVVHLHKAREETWARDTAALMNPCNGLNAEVVQRRFLIRHMGGRVAVEPGASTTSSGASRAQMKKRGAATAPSSAPLLCRLPYPHAAERRGGDESSAAPKSAGAADADTWRGQVHSVCVQREETYSSMARLKATKGGRGRQQRWQAYFTPLLRHYASAGGDAIHRDRRAAAAAAAAAARMESDGEADSTLLEAPLATVRYIVLADRDEKLGDVRLTGPDAAPSASASASSAAAAAGVAHHHHHSSQDQQRLRQRTHAAVAAALEHAVVGVLFHAAHDAEEGGGAVVRSLATLPHGFPVTCYGVVESSESELLRGRDPHAGADAASSTAWIRIRVPLRPSAVAALLSDPAALSTTTTTTTTTTAAAASQPIRARCLSIAYSAALRADTATVEAWL